jgi:molybdopterin-containing oxidoreductase family iron-sulfur binding subunit
LWRSLEELQDAPDLQAWLDAEFPNIARAGSMDRRSWLRLVGASLALAGLPACSGEGAVGDPPLLSPPEHLPGHVPGTPLFVATSLELAGLGRGVLVKTQEGRPFKIEGNPLHPASLGATDVWAQAEVLSLYDPDRSRTPLQQGAERTWEDAERLLATMRTELAFGRGKGWRFLLPQTASPTLDRLVAAMRQGFPEARWHRPAPLAPSGAQAGAISAFGRAVDLVPDLTQADLVLTLGGDIFLFEPGHIRLAADWQARRRNREKPLPRLVAVESTPSLAGARADQRIPLRPRLVEGFAHALWAGLAQNAVPAEAHPAVATLLAELRRAGPRAVVLAGREQPAAVHALALAINAHLGAFGTTVHAIEPVVAPTPPEEDLPALAEAITAGEVSGLVILGANPAYDAPADLDFGRLVRRVPLSVHLGFGRDETAAASTWHLPKCHPLESFGDLRAFDGIVGFRQPACVRLVPSLSPEELLANLLGQAPDGRELLAATWAEQWGADFDIRFTRALEDGVVEGSAAPRIPVALRPDWSPAPRPPLPPAELDILFSLDPSLWDGSYANNAWLQELPKPLTKQVWGNAALIAPETAAARGLSTGDLIEVIAGERRVAAPVWLLPGHAPDTVTLPLGYGRESAGAVGWRVGFDAYLLRTAADPWITSGTLTPLGSQVELISTQHHHALPGHAVFRIVSADRPDAGGPPAKLPSLYPEWRYEGHAWGMSIDLDACIGCNACVIACQAENNVMVVGPEEVARGREMHWLRIDRYHGGAPENPDTFFQPVLCMHCEKAPCEVVCPVNATVHSAEGLNDMVYNRCVGTRTCSNNCPYKVRRFNFFDYSSAELAPPDDALNPHVTIRERGVMEKCTYCIQRIWTARTQANVENRPIRDGEIVTACQQACPTQAFRFGDVNDENSAVSRLKREPRDYAMLGELNTQPRTTYLARIAPTGENGG